jgi:hypothetical protein
MLNKSSKRIRFQRRRTDTGRVHGEVIEVSAESALLLIEQLQEAVNRVHAQTELRWLEVERS